jgi:hypothetical protein
MLSIQHAVPAQQRLPSVSLHSVNRSSIPSTLPSRELPSEHFKAALFIALRWHSALVQPHVDTLLHHEPAIQCVSMADKNAINEATHKHVSVHSASWSASSRL